MRRARKIKTNGGQALLLAVLLFLFLSVTAITGISMPILRQSNIVSDFLLSRKSLFLSEAGIEDSVYRIRNNKQISASESLSLGGVSVTTTIANTTGTKTIYTSASGNNLIRKMESILKTGVGSSFSYGIQSGQGGFTLGNNATVNGSVYSNGPISGSNGAAITGTAISANGPALTADQVNDTPVTPPNSVRFGDANKTQDFAQGFKVTVSETLAKVSLYIKKTSTPSSLAVRVVSDNAGSPGATTLASAVLDASLVTTSYGWVDVSFPDVNLTNGTTYWLVLDGVTSSSKYYTIGANSSYANGQAKIGQYGGTWNNTSPVGLSSYFRIYLGGITGLINGVNVGVSGVGDAQAHSVTGSVIAGNLYCQVGSGNNKSCNTSKTDPNSLDYAISEGNILDWKNLAVAGGVINGDYTLSSSGSLGPKKIAGNLNIINNKTLTLTGTLWVTGNIILNNGGKIQLDSSYGANSGVVVSDGTVTVSNNSLFAGSGQSGSYLLVVSTSNCPTGSSCAGAYAIDVSNNAGAVIIDAQSGTIHLNNNASVKQLTADKIVIDNGTTINYEQGITNTNFTNGPTGGWTIKTWAETE